MYNIKDALNNDNNDASQEPAVQKCKILLLSQFTHKEVKDMVSNF